MTMQRLIRAALLVCAMTGAALADYKVTVNNKTAKYRLKVQMSKVCMSGEGPLTSSLLEPNTSRAASFYFQKSGDCGIKPTQWTISITAFRTKPSDNPANDVVAVLTHSVVGDAPLTGGDDDSQVWVNMPKDVFASSNVTFDNLKDTLVFDITAVETTDDIEWFHLGWTKTAGQVSDLNSDGIAAHAVDRIDSGVFSHGGMSHTKDGEPAPWWEVDLDGQYDIAGIEILNRTECCQNTLEHFKVQVSPTPITPATGGGWLGPGTVKSSYDLNLRGQRGRFVRITRTTPGYLALAEVKIRGVREVAAGRPLVEVGIGLWSVDLGGVLAINRVDLDPLMDPNNGAPYWKKFVLISTEPLDAKRVADIENGSPANSAPLDQQNGKQLLFTQSSTATKAYLNTRGFRGRYIYARGYSVKPSLKIYSSDPQTPLANEATTFCLRTYNGKNFLRGNQPRVTATSTVCGANETFTFIQPAGGLVHGGQFTLRAYDKKHVSARSNGEVTEVPNIDAWEKITIEHQDNAAGALRAGDAVVLKAWNAYWIAAKDGGGNDTYLSPNRQTWETFTLVESNYKP